MSRYRDRWHFFLPQTNEVNAVVRKECAHLIGPSSHSATAKETRKPVGTACTRQQTIKESTLGGCTNLSATANIINLIIRYKHRLESRGDPKLIMEIAGATGRNRAPCFLISTAAAVKKIRNGLLCSLREPPLRCNRSPSSASSPIREADFFQCRFLFLINYGRRMNIMVSSAKIVPFALESVRYRGGISKACGHGKN